MRKQLYYSVEDSVNSEKLRGCAGISIETMSGPDGVGRREKLRGRDEHVRAKLNASGACISTYHTAHGQ